MRGASVLVVEVVGVLPDVEGQEGLEAVGDGVVGVGVLDDGQFAVGVGLEPDPAGAEEADAFCLKLGLEGVETPPLLFDLGKKSRFLHALRLVEITKLGEVHLVVQDLTGVVEDRPLDCARGDRRDRFARDHNDFFQTLVLELCTCNQFVEIVNIRLQMLPVMERQRFVTDHRCKRSVRELN